MSDETAIDPTLTGDEKPAALLLDNGRCAVLPELTLNEAVAAVYLALDIDELIGTASPRGTRKTARRFAPLGNPGGRRASQRRGLMERSAAMKPSSG